MSSTRRSKLRRLSFRLLFAFAMALLLALLGTFQGTGYHVHDIEELSFVPNYNYGYADAVFKFNATYNPIVYPLYWVLGKGQVSGEFSMIYLAQGYERSEWAFAIFGNAPEDHFGEYISYMVTWGTFANFGLLIVIAVIIEALRRRVLYLPLLAGVCGFAVAGINGILIGLPIGAIVAAIVVKKRFTIDLSVSGLRGHIIRRIAYSFILVLAIITINFILFFKMPGNPLDMFSQPVSGGAKWRLGSNETAVFLQDVRRLWGFDQPVIAQYFTYVRNLLFFNLGSMGTPQSVEHEVTPITQSLAQRLPYTIFLLSTALCISLAIGVFIGVKAIQHRGGKLDTLSSVIPIVISCTPVWWIGFVLLANFGYALRVTYSGGTPIGGGSPLYWRVDPPIPFGVSTSFSSTSLQIGLSPDFGEIVRLIGGYLQFAILPLIALVLSLFGQWVLLTRASMLETVSEDYILTARAKGMTEWRILMRHAWKNACLPIVTNAAISFGFIVMGSVLVETVFSYPGIGAWLFDSIRFGDIPILMTVFYVVALCVILANLIADLLYGLIDPRIKTA